jgi:hypothetical protein
LPIGNDRTPWNTAPLNPIAAQASGLLLGVVAALVAHSSAGMRGLWIARAGNAATDSINAEATPAATTRLNRDDNRGLDTPLVYTVCTQRRSNRFTPRQKGRDTPKDTPGRRALYTLWLGSLRWPARDGLSERSRVQVEISKLPLASDLYEDNEGCTLRNMEHREEPRFWWRRMFGV